MSDLYPISERADREAALSAMPPAIRDAFAGSCDDLVSWRARLLGEMKSRELAYDRHRGFLRRRPVGPRLVAVAVRLLAIAISGWCAAELWMAISPGGAP